MLSSMEARHNPKAHQTAIFVAATIPTRLWKEVKLRAVNEGTTLRQLVENSLRLYLKTPISRQKKQGRA